MNTKEDFIRAYRALRDDRNLSNNQKIRQLAALFFSPFLSKLSVRICSSLSKSITPEDILSITCMKVLSLRKFPNLNETSVLRYINRSLWNNALRLAAKENAERQKLQKYFYEVWEEQNDPFCSDPPICKGRSSSEVRAAIQIVMKRNRLYGRVLNFSRIGLKCPDIAKYLALETNQVRYLLSKARDSLKAVLEDWD